MVENKESNTVFILKVETLVNLATSSCHDFPV